VIAEQNIDALAPAQLREALRSMLVAVRHKDALIDKLTHENAVLKRLKFAAQSERFDAEQRSLLEETLDADLQAVSEEIERLKPEEAAPRERQIPKRQPLPANLPRREVRHDPENTTCACGCQMKRIGEDVAKKLDYVPGVFTVERHIRGKWACADCEKLVQAPVAPHVIDKGIPTAGLLAQVLVAKYADHLPLYRQEGIFARAGFAIPRSTLAQWVGSAGVHLLILPRFHVQQESWKLELYGESRCEIARCRNGSTRMNSRSRRSDWQNRSAATRRRAGWAFRWPRWATGSVGERRLALRHLRPLEVLQPFRHVAR